MAHLCPEISGDPYYACEMLVAAELTLIGGFPAFLAPAGWPSYDVIAQQSHGAPLRISVKSSSYTNKTDLWIG